MREERQDPVGRCTVLLLRPSLLLTILIGCSSDRSPGAARARDLTRALGPQRSDTTRDTTAARRAEEFQKCVYVYDRQEKLRECLVIIHGWRPQDADRGIAIYTARIQHTSDSILAIVRRKMAAEAAELRRKMAAEAAELRRQDAYAASKPYWGSKKAKVYYTNTPNCFSLGTIERYDRRLFDSESSAQAAGYKRTEERGC